MIWSAERKALIRRLHDKGYSALRISEEMFSSQHYKDSILSQIRRMKLQRTRPLVRMSRRKPVVPWFRVSSSERAQRLAEVPADHRNLTARLCGDPLPGRSALDRDRHL
jgi:hypothetical protein